MIYGINILITPKSSDLYDAVAVNKAPIFIQCESEDRLKELLLTDKSIHRVASDLMKTNKVKKTARFCYRSFGEPDKISYLDCNIE